MQDLGKSVDALGDSKEIEKARYNEVSRKLLNEPTGLAGALGSESVPLPLRGPYIYYECVVKEAVKPHMRVLDVCCGNGKFSLTAAFAGAKVIAADIAEWGVLATVKRAQMHGLKIDGVVADAEGLPFGDQTFDVVTVTFQSRPDR
jgi:2-polyprenyl-3-methyl-5-hydroxy-6-metoxy-1,4-benzoquinol methylase